MSVQAAPHWGDAFDLKQPDGSVVAVKVWGDEYYQRVESIDGYSLIRNEYGWICYADLSADGDEFVATDIVYDGVNLDQIPDIKQYEKTNYPNRIDATYSWLRTRPLRQLKLTSRRVLLR
jgi:hypothetical protein